MAQVMTAQPSRDAGMEVAAMDFFGAFSFWHWVVLLIVVVLVFGTKRLSTFGSDLGAAVKSFKHAMREATEDQAASEREPHGVPGPNASDPRGPSTPL
jgi:sec-independent protein translocase protein TatA